MGRLDEVDLSLRLSREEEERGPKREGERLAQLRLALAGLIGGRRLGPPLMNTLKLACGSGG